MQDEIWKPVHGSKLFFHYHKQNLQLCKPIDMQSTACTYRALQTVCPSCHEALICPEHIHCKIPLQASTSAIVSTGRYVSSCVREHRSKCCVTRHSDMTGLAGRRPSAEAAEKPAGNGDRACMGWGRAEGRGTMRLSLRGGGVRGNVSSS